VARHLPPQAGGPAVPSYEGFTTKDDFVATVVFDWGVIGRHRGDTQQQAAVTEAHLEGTEPGKAWPTSCGTIAKTRGGWAVCCFSSQFVHPVGGAQGVCRIRRADGPRRMLDFFYNMRGALGARTEQLTSSRPPRHLAVEAVVGAAEITALLAGDNHAGH